MILGLKWFYFLILHKWWDCALTGAFSWKGDSSVHLFDHLFIHSFIHLLIHSFRGNKNENVKPTRVSAVLASSFIHSFNHSFKLYSFGRSVFLRRRLVGSYVWRISEKRHSSIIGSWFLTCAKKLIMTSESPKRRKNSNWRKLEVEKRGRKINGRNVEEKKKWNVKTKNRPYLYLSKKKKKISMLLFWTALSLTQV